MPQTHQRSVFLRRPHTSAVSVADYIVEGALPQKESTTALALPAITCFQAPSGQK
jgi:hypothetical protein